MDGKVKVSVHTNFMDAYTGEQHLAGDVLEVTESRYRELSERLGADVSPLTEGSEAQSEAGNAPSSDGEKPTGDSTKAEIKAYLDAHGVGYPAKATKPELLALVP